MENHPLFIFLSSFFVLVSREISKGVAFPYAVSLFPETFHRPTPRIWMAPATGGGQGRTLFFNGLAPHTTFSSFYLIERKKRWERKSLFFYNNKKQFGDWLSGLCNLIGSPEKKKSCVIFLVDAGGGVGVVSILHSRTLGGVKGASLSLSSLLLAPFK